MLQIFSNRKNSKQGKKIRIPCSPFISMHLHFYEINEFEIFMFSESMKNKYLVKKVQNTPAERNLTKPQNFLVLALKVGLKVALFFKI